MTEQTISAIKIVVAFGTQQIELDNFNDAMKNYSKISEEGGKRGGWGFGVLYFCIYLSYSYAFAIGALWVDLGITNHTYDRPYGPGDIIAVFFGLLFAMFGLAGLGPNIQ